LNDIYAHKSGTVEYRSSGLGLGLAISKRIAELHNGQIIIKSKENEGTSVFMIIPFK
jgi:signal transduction histidine kinase